MARSFEILKSLACSLFLYLSMVANSRRLTEVQTQPEIQSEFQVIKDYEVRSHLKNKKTNQKNIYLMRNKKMLRCVCFALFGFITKYKHSYRDQQGVHT